MKYGGKMTAPRLIIYCKNYFFILYYIFVHAKIRREKIYICSLLRGTAVGRFLWLSKETLT